MPGRELAGRRFWFVGICGDGMSALALLAADLGAEVGGSDLKHSRFSPLLDRAGVEVVIGVQRAENVPTGAEVVYSSAVPLDNPEVSAAGRSLHRGALLAEIVSARPSIVVGGTHGKTTTAAMIAFCLQELGRDPAFVLGTEVPQLGGNAGAGEGWLVTEGDEADRSIELLEPTIAVLTNVDFDHHSTFASRAEVEELLERWVARSDQVVHGEQLEPVEAELGVPGEHNRRNAAAALAALELAGVPPDETLPVLVRYRGAGHRFERHGEQLEPVEAELGVPGEHNRRNAAAALAALELAGVPPDEALPVLARYRGAGHRFERQGEAAGVTVISDYGHHPAEIALTIATAREQAAGRVLVVFRPLRYSRTRHLARELAVALATADAVAVADVSGASEPRPDGVSGKLVVDALAELRPGMPLAWTPELPDAAAFVARRARPGDLVMAQGADDVVTVAPLVLEALR